MKGKGAKILWILFFLIVAGLIVVIYVIPGAQSMLAQTTVVEYGEIILRTETEAYIVREETAFDGSGPDASEDLPADFGVASKVSQPKPLK